MTVSVEIMCLNIIHLFIHFWIENVFKSFQKELFYVKQKSQVIKVNCLKGCIPYLVKLQMDRLINMLRGLFKDPESLQMLI